MNLRDENRESAGRSESVRSEEPSWFDRALPDGDAAQSSVGVDGPAIYRWEDDGGFVPARSRG